MTTNTSDAARRTIRNAGALAIASIFNKGMLFVWLIVLARWLGDAAYGIYGTVGALATIATVIGSLGMGLIVVRDVSRHPQLAGRYLTATLFIQTAFGGLAFVAINAAAYGLGYSEAVRVFTFLTGIGLLIDIYGNMCSDQLLAQERMVTTSLVEALHIILRIGLVALVLWRGFGLPGLYLVGMGVSLVRSLIFWWALRNTGVRPVFPMQMSIALPLFLNSLPLAISAVLTLAYQQADKLMSTALLTEASTGYLTAAFVIITGVIELLNSTILIATYPMMSRSYEASGAGFGFIVEKLAYFTVIVTLPICLVLSVFAPQITTPLFGSDFAPTAGVIRLLIWYALAAMVVNIFAQGMMVQNRQRSLLFIRMGGLALNLILNLTLLLRYELGLMGLVYASVAAEIVVLGVILVTFREYEVNTLRLAGRTALALLLGVVIAAAMVFAGQLHFTVGVAAGLLIYAGVVMGGGMLADDEWDLLYRLVTASPGGGLITRYWQRDMQPA